MQTAENSSGSWQPGTAGHVHRTSTEVDVATAEHLSSYATLQRSQSPVDSFDDATISATWQKEEQHRLEDDLAIFQAERLASQDQATLERTYSRSMHRNRSKQPDHVDEFEENTNPVHEHHAQYRTPDHPTTKFAQAYKRIHESSFIIRYFTYIAPLTLLLLVPLLLGRLLYNSANVGGVHLFWFSIWLEILWLTLWAGRILAKCVPYPLGLFASLFTNEDKRWRDMGKQLELPGTLFFWWLGVEISWLPTMNNHILSGYTGDLTWIQTVNKIIVSVFVGVILNFAEKIIIQLIAISFHLRTYADRIETNRFQINSLVKMYQYSKEKLTVEDNVFDENAQSGSGPGSGARTPRIYVEKAQRNVLSGFRKVGDVAGKVAGDFTGRRVVESTHPSQVILVLLNTTSGSQTLARRLHRTFVRPEEENVFEEDISVAFESNDEAEAAFGMLDKDLNGDISMEELESVCVETGRERKSITASLKDLDSVISKLDAILSFLVAVITILVFISLISTSAAGVLTSAGSSILALSWLFSATAQELLQSIIFVFVKHPFDVGDRVSIYGNTGSTLKGDDYFVKEISLLYTEFKKMEGHVVQAPNSYLNTLFILNQRRSGGLAEAVPLTIKFGTSLEQIDGLRAKLLDFVKEEKRDYQSNILTEVRDIVEAYSVNINVIFFYKSNWQNEGLRLQRRNKFICHLMISMQELGIEGPRQRWAGQRKELPFFLDLGQSKLPNEAAPFPQDPSAASFKREQEDNVVEERSNTSQIHSALKISGSRMGGRPRADSVTSVAKKVGFLDVSGVVSSNPMGDVHDEHNIHLGPRHRQISNLNRRASIVSHATSRQSTDAQGTGFQSEIQMGPLGPRRSDTSRSQEPILRQARPWRSNSTLRRHGDERYDLMEQGMVAIPEAPAMDRS